MNRVAPFTKTCTLLCTLLLLGASLLFALPPLEVEVSEPSTLDVSWPDTGESVQLETSGDLGFWQTLPGAPTIDDGRFRQSVAIDGMGGYFRLTEATVDPNAPVYEDLPETTPIFPGETISFTLSATDTNGLAIRYLAEPLPLPEGASLNTETGEFAWKPTAEQVGTTGITFLAYNGTVSGRLPVSFTVESAPAGGETSLSGILLDTNNAVDGNQQPISGATVSLLGTDRSTVSGADGRFLLENIPGDTQILDIDTKEATPAPDGSPYASFREALVVVEGIPNVITRPLYLPRIAIQSLKKVLPNFTTKVENTDTGTSLTVPPHTAMMGDEEFEGELSISEVPEALAPAALPESLGFGQLVTIQPVGVTFAQPVPITFKNVDNLPPDSETDIWSLDPDAGVFTVVGTGKVTPDGEFIETVKGGVIAADWHGTLPPGIAPGNGPGGSGPGSPPPSSPPSGGPGSGDGGDGGDGGEGGPGDGTGDSPPGCPGDSNSGSSAPFGSQVLLADGAVLTSVATPSYLSGGQERSLGLVYHSLTACPRIVVPIQATISARSAVPRRVSLDGDFGGLSGTTPVFFDTSALSESVDETFSAGISFDARGIATGFAPYTIRATSHFARSTVTADITDQAVVVNRSESAIGAGWGFAGDQQIISANEDDSAQLLISGDGSYQLFRDAATFAPFTIASLGGERASSYAFADGALFDQAREAITEEFPAVAFRSVELLGQATDSELMVLTPYASATEGAPLTAADQSALSSFVRGGGCAIVFLDHTLGRASFEASMASLLEPFQITGANVQGPGSDVSNPTHPLVAGDFGTVDRIDLPFGGYELDAASNAALQVIAPGLTLIPKDALGNGSGPVVFVSDTQAYVDDATIGFESSAAHQALLLNAIQFCLRSQRDPGADLDFVGPNGDFSLLAKRPNGTFFREMPNGLRYEFNTRGRLSQSIARNGQTMAFGYDAAGNLTRITDPFGQETQLSYAGGMLAQVTDPAGRRTTFQHDAAGNLVRVEQPDGSANQYEYDADHLMTAEINAVSGRTERGYDAAGRAVSATLPDGSVRMVESVQGLAASLEGTLGTDLNPVPVKRPEDLVASYTNGAGDTHRVTIGQVGTANELADSAGRVRTIVRNDDGKPTQLSLETGRVFNSQYDRFGRRTSLTDSATGSTLTTSYDGNTGAPISVDNGRGETALFGYDENGRLTEATGFGGQTTTTTYLGNGTLPATVTDPSGLTTAISYDSAGNATMFDTGGSTTSIARSPEGYISRITDAEGRFLTADYNTRGDRTRIVLPGGAAVNYAYDNRGFPTGVTLPSGAQHSFSYDTRGRLTSFVSPLGDDFRASYDYTDGRRSRVSWGDDTEIRYAYSEGRLSSITTTDGNLTLTRGAATGLLDQLASTGNHQLNYTYDPHGRLLDAQWSGMVDGEVSRSYDNRGRVASTTVNDTPSLAVSYNADDFITASGPMTITRDAATGRPISASLGNCSDAWTYNAFSELLTYTASVNNNIIYSLTLTRDRLGRVLSKDETIEGTRYTSTFRYNAAGQLAQETRNGVVITYTYDANGNRLSRTEAGGATETGTYNAGDQLTSYAGTAYSYDGGGRLSARGADTFDYDVMGGLQSANLSRGAALTYQHPVGGRRLGERSNGAITRQFLYSGPLTIAAELDPTGAVRSVFGYGTLNGSPDFLQRDGRTYRIISDDLGSPRLVVDCDSGQIVQRMRHDAFGRVLEDTAPRFQPFGFAGGLYDPGTGWVRFGARDYDAFIGRWTAADPSLFVGSVVNLYAYASGDPVNLIDRNGLEDSPATGGGCSTGGGGSIGSQCLADLDSEFNDSRAKEELDANAHTQGGDIVFGDGYDPSTGAGQELVTHEITHTLQQSGNDSCPATTSNDREELSADAVVRLVRQRGSGPLSR